VRARTGWLLGALILLMLICALYFLFSVFTYDPGQRTSPILAGTFFGTLALFLALLLGLAVFCIKHLKRNGLVSTNARGWWTVALLLAGVVAIPHYWWTYLRPGAAERPIDPFSPVRDTRTISVPSSARTVHQALQLLIEETRGWRIVADAQDLRVRVGPSWRSWGEEITITIQDQGPNCIVIASTRPVLRTTVLDFGKSQRDLDAIVRAVATIS
jgi:hypothetical protein